MHRVEVSAPFFLIFFMFVSHFKICKIPTHALCEISLSPSYNPDRDATHAEKLVDVDSFFENVRNFKNSPFTRQRFPLNKFVEYHWPVPVPGPGSNNNYPNPAAQFTEGAFLGKIQNRIIGRD